MILRESWLVGWLRDNSPNLKFKVFAAPRQRQVIGGGNLFPWANMVYANSPNKDLAWRFIDFVFTPENDLEQNMAQGNLPVCEAGYDSDYVRKRPDYESVRTVLKQGPGPAYGYYIPKMNQLADVFGDAILAVMFGKSEAKPALDAAATKMDAILARE
jgi:multiple sugar transport system substrate-binding protein